MDKLKEVDWRGMVKSATQKVKKYTLNLTDLELKVEEATNAETWGPHGSVMNEIADAAFDPENYRQIMGVLARRLQERDENWRMCYKALLLLEHLLKHGPAKIVGDVQSSSAVLERLEGFQYKDANLKDHGVNVRHRAKEILQLVNHPERLREEREKAKANRSKYRGVSADQMRTGSFGRSGSGYGGGGASGSLFASSGGGGGGGYGGYSGGGGGSFGASRRTESYDETEHDSHFVSKRQGTTSGGAAAAPDAGEAVAATRARIERLKLSGAVAEEGKPGEGAESKKKLTDVRVNPKIAASLGLKIPVQAPPSAAPAAAAPAPAPAAAGVMDLLGGLEDPAPTPATAPVAAPAAAPAFDPFAAPAAAAPAPAAAQPSWDAFAGAAPAPAAPAAPVAASPLDLLGGIGAAAAAAPAFDPFAAAAPPAAPAQQQRPAAPPADPFASFAAPQAAAAAGPASPKGPPAATVAAGLPGALPEDMFSDLTGIGSRPPQPMGLAAAHNSTSSSAVGGVGGWGLPPSAAAPGVSPPSPAGFGDFSSGGSAGLGNFSSAGAVPAGGAPAAGGMAAPAGHVRSHSRGGSMGGAADFGSFSYSSGPQQGSASAADPFANLLS